MTGVLGPKAGTKAGNDQNPLDTDFPMQVQKVLGSGTWLLLSRLWQVRDTGVGTHQDIAGVQRALQEKLLRFRQVNPTKRGFGKGICWHQGQAINSDLMYTVNGLEY